MNWWALLLNRLLDRHQPRARRQAGKNAAIAKILRGKGPKHAGMGIVVDPWHVLTCAHVVNTAIEAEKTNPERPGNDTKVFVEFPLLGGPGCEASIEEWAGPGNDPEHDIALLKLDKPVSDEVGFAMFGNLSGVLPDGDPLSAYGLTPGQTLGNHIDAEFVGPTSAAWVQIDAADNNKGVFVQGGFSGASVWNKPQSAVVGMLVAKKVSDAQQIAYMIPTADLAQFWRPLPVENRRLWPSFGRTWTILSAVFFVLLLSHFLVDRGVFSVQYLTISGPHKPLASFWGMHLYAFLAPVLLLMVIGFARSFRLHTRVARVPSFGAFSRYPVPSSTWRSAAASVALLVVLPLAAQFHFIDHFRSDGYVYIYKGTFGYADNSPAFHECSGGGKPLCRIRPEAGRYWPIKSIDGSKTPYWDNAYHYGDIKPGQEDDRGSATFFPGLQPAAIGVLTVISMVLWVFALFFILRPTPFAAMAEEASQPPSSEAK